MQAANKLRLCLLFLFLSSFSSFSTWRWAHPCFPRKEGVGGSCWGCHRYVGR